MSEPSPPTPRLYADLAAWWPLLSAPADYAEESAFYLRLLRQHGIAGPGTALELGSGGGNNASHMKRHFRLVLVDASPGMLAVSRVLNPECDHLVGDMRDVRLGRTFDAVFVHDAVMYLLTEEDLRAGMATAFAHCRPGGVALFVPDCVRETFRPAAAHGGHDDPASGRGLRYLEWTWDPDPDDTRFRTDFAYLLREPDGSVRAEQDVHHCGLFPRETWRRGLEAAGFRVAVVPSGGAAEVGELFVGVRAGS